MDNQLITSEEALFELLTLTCVTTRQGDKFYKNKEGQFHRIHGPAVVYASGYEAWYRKDILHREDGPARIFENNHKEYWINDVELSKERFIQWQKKNGIKPIE